MQPGNFYPANAALALSDDGQVLAYASGGHQARALLRDVAAHRFSDSWPLPAGYERMITLGPARFLLVREQLDSGGQNVQSVAWQLEPGVPPRQLRILRPSGPSDQSGFFASGLTPDGRLHWWTGPRVPPGQHRLEIRRVDTGELVAIPRYPTTGIMNEVFAYLEPSGERFWVQAHARGDVTVHRLDGSPSPNGKGTIPLCVSTDGRWYIREAADTRRRHTTLALWADEADQPWLHFTNEDLSPPGRGSFSPDGRYLAWHSQSGTITVADLSALQQEVAAFEASLRAEE